MKGLRLTTRHTPHNGRILKLATVQYASSSASGNAQYSTYLMTENERLTQARLMMKHHELVD